MSTTYLFLGGAILLEVIATTLLKTTDGFTKLLPTIGCLIGYATSFYLLSFALKVLPTGIAYAIWSGVGIVLISMVSWLWFKQALDGPAIAGIGLIICGVVVVNLFSKSVTH